MHEPYLSSTETVTVFHWQVLCEEMPVVTRDGFIESNREIPHFVDTYSAIFKFQAQELAAGSNYSR